MKTPQEKKIDKLTDDLATARDIVTSCVTSLQNTCALVDEYAIGDPDSRARAIMVDLKKLFVADSKAQRAINDSYGWIRKK